MTTEITFRKTLVSLWLPIAVLLLGFVFFIFIFIEYQRNTSLIEQNRSLISGSAKTQLINNITTQERGLNWANNKHKYGWVKQTPSTYWFKGGVQEFPWSKPLTTKPIPDNQQWQVVWSELNTPLTSDQKAKYVNTQRLSLLISIKKALSNDDEALIQQSFDAYLEHKNAYHLSPQEEIAFSLKLIEIGAQKHWSPELIHAILITGGSSEMPIIRPVIDLLFKHAELFSSNEINWISNNVKQQLETFNLNHYFLDDYLQHLNQPQFTLPSNLLTESKQLTYKANKHWLLHRVSDLNSSATPIDLKEELMFIEKEFIGLGVLNLGDSLSLNSIRNNTLLSDISINVTKTQLTNDIRNQLAYLIIKSILLIVFIGLILLTLRLIAKDQQRRLEYIALKEDFVKLVSHELKTPLAGIRAMAETLQRRIDRDLSAQSYPDRIINEADKLWYMVDNILGFNRVQLNNTVINKQPTRIHSICESVIHDVRSLSSKPYSIDNTINESTEVQIDHELFTLVIKNILINAGLYNDCDTIEIELRFDKNQSCLFITDNGIGISESDYDDVFKPFVRLNQSVRQSGTGLGLAMCKRIMQLHNGDLSLADSSTNGSVWKISFEQ